MAKPATFDGYTDQYTVDCERVLVTLLRGLGERTGDVVELLEKLSQLFCPWLTNAPQKMPS